MDMAKRVEDMGANSLCIKDMAGLLVPSKATELVQALKDSTSLPIELHTHYTSGVASMTYMKAVEAGCDIIDTAISPFSMGTSQPATEVMVEAFKGTEFDTGLDQNLLAEIADYFRPMREEALESGLMNTKVLGVNIKTLLYQVPGGMLSNMVSQLKEQHAEDKYEEVLKEIPRVRKDLGEPPLVTPSSQIVGTQAVFNVLMGERYKVATKETKDLLSGKYGQTVKPMNPDVIKKVLGDDPEIITCRPADLIPDELDTLRKECEQWIQQDEDVLSYALFPQVAVDFFKYREAQQTKVDATVADTENGSYPVQVFERTSSVEVPDSMRLRVLARRKRKKDDKIRTEYIRTENPDDFPPQVFFWDVLVAHPKSYFIVFFSPTPCKAPCECIEPGTSTLDCSRKYAEDIG